MIRHEEILSSDTQDILEKPPANLLLFGMGGIIVGIALLFTVSFLFTYPDTVRGDLVLTTSVPPVPVVAKTTGYLAEIRVKEGSVVQKDSIVAVFETKAKVEDILKLEFDLENISQFDLASLQSFEPDLDLSLGELAESYSGFINVLQYLPLNENAGADEAAIAGTNTYIREIQRDISALNRIRAQKIHERDEAQRSVNDIYDNYSKTQDESYGRALFGANTKLKELISEIASLDARIEKRKDDLLSGNAKMLELRITQQSGTKEKVLNLKQSFSALKTEIGNWKDKYLIIAPVDGKVSLFKDLSETQYIKTGDDLMMITPELENTELIGRVKLPVKGSGKVKNNDAVKINFDRFPERDFGYVTGNVSKIYALPVGDAYFVEVSLNKGLVTNTGKEIKFEQQLSGKAEITTAERKIFARIFESLLN